MGKGEGMIVFVVVAPQDYQSAEVIGVYTKRKMAENAKKSAERDGRRNSDLVFIQEVSLEG